MGKLPYYIGKVVQVAGLLLVLDAWIISVAQNGSMNFLFKVTATGMVVFMIGWTIQKYF